LLLLSTKKGQNSAADSISGGGNGGGTGNGGNGYMASSSSSLSNRTKVVKGNSTHDALVNALNGGDRRDAVQEKVPSAWGIQTPASTSSSGTTAGVTNTTTTIRNSSNDKIQHAQNIEKNHDKVQHSSTDEEVTHVGRAVEETSQNKGREDKYDDNDQPFMKSKDEINDTDAAVIYSETESLAAHDGIPTRHEGNSRVTPTDILSAGATTATANTTSISTANDDGKSDQPLAQSSPLRESKHEVFSEDQVEFMKKLAKERAEKRRQEEIERESLLKERAMQRLHELDMKLKLEKEKNQQRQQQQQQTEKDHSDPNMDASHRVVPFKQLYDPKKSYSSLLGGVQPMAKEITSTNSTAVPNVPVPISSTPALPTSPLTTQPSPENMIHFSSYEDQNRGTRNSDAGPRMLFDPKSGSMVAAPTPSKEKKTTKKNVPRKNSKDVNDDASSLTYASREEKDVYGKSAQQNTKIRQLASNRNMKDIDDKKLPPKSEFSTLKSQRTLPRTCGVLYKYDENGKIVPADGCEGDRGYGAHSVPGGRIKNPKAYAAIKQKEQETTKRHIKHPNNMKHGIEASSNEQNYGTSLNRSHFMRKTPNQQSNDTGSAIPSSILEVLRGDEKLDLLSNLDASPKLQATAAAWAPSQAVLALTATNVKHISREVISLDPDVDMESGDQISESGVHAMNAIALIDADSENEILEHGDPSPSIDFGLGFDPSKNMDSLMMSPATGTETPSNIDITDLKLKDSPSHARSASNPFITSNTILGSSTWGTGGSNSSTMGSLSNWDLLSNKSNPQRASIQRNEGPKTFLSLGVGGDEATWSGSHGTPFAGFNGIDAPSMGSSD